MVPRPEVCIIFSIEKERSALDTVTGNTVNNAHTVVRSGTKDRILELLISLSQSSLDSEAAISVLNLCRNERNLNMRFAAHLLLFPSHYLIGLADV